MLTALIYSNPYTQFESFRLPFEISFAVQGYLISNRVLYKFPSFVPITQTEISSICCNDSLVLATSISGRIFGWGDDKYGLMGFGEVFHELPRMLDFAINIEKCSLGPSHAAAITTQGLLHTWGPFPHAKLGGSVFVKNSPRPVKSAENYKAEEVACGNNFTCIRTDGCYLLVYGEIGNDHSIKINSSPRKSVALNNKEKGPYSHPKLDSETIVKIVACSNFIVVLLENGEICVFDSCMCLIKFNCEEKNIKDVLANDNFVWGLSENEINVWERNWEEKGYLECPIKEWKNESFKVFNDCKVFNWGEKFLVVAKENNVFKEKSRYSLNIIVEKKSFSYLIDSPQISKEKISPKASMESLQRMYSKGNNEKLIEKIVKCRAEFNNRGTLLEAFKHIVHPIAKIGFFHIKQYVTMKKNYELYQNTLKFSEFFQKLLIFRMAKKFTQWKKIILAEKLEKLKIFKFRLINIQNKYKKHYMKVFTTKLIKCRDFFRIMSKLCRNHMEITLNSVNFYSVSHFHNSLNTLITRLHTFFAMKHFSFCLFAFRSLKNHSNFIQDTYLLTSESSDSMNEENFELKEEYYIDLHTLNLAKSESSIISSQFMRNFEELQQNDGPTKFKYFSHRPTAFNNGDLMKYQKFLINKKKLEMIEEDVTFIDKNKQTVRYKRKKKEKTKERPPWKPASAASNFNFKKKKDSAIDKGYEYYEKLVDKKKPAKVLNISKIEEKNTKIILKESKSASIFHEYFDSKNSSSPLFPKLENYTPPNENSESIVGIGLGMILCEKIIRMKLKKHLKNCFQLISLSKKQVIPITNNKNKFESKGKETLLTQNSWQTRVILIGIQNIKKMIVKRYHRLIFNRIVTTKR